MKGKSSSGFAVLLVLWALIMLSTIALSLAATVTAEVRNAGDSWSSLQAERLARSGHEMEAYLETRGLAGSSENLSGLRVEAITPGSKYRVNFDAGSVDITLEGENGKFDLTSASEDELVAFFTAWTGDPDRGRTIAASIRDWADPDDDPQPFGAEFAWYLSRGYRPRNAGLGGADLALIRGLTREDFFPSIVTERDRLGTRPPLTRFVAAVPGANRVNPNYASRVVLQGIKDISPELADRIVAKRREGDFKSADDFRDRLGLTPDSPVLNRVIFSRGPSSTVTTIARLNGSSASFTESRSRNEVRPFGRGNFGQSALWYVQRGPGG